MSDATHLWRPVRARATIVAVLAVPIVVALLGLWPSSATAAVRLFQLPVGTFPEAITAGPDGALWFTSAKRESIGRITSAGRITWVGSTPGAQDLVTGPDGALWYAALDRIGRLTANGTITEFPVPNENAYADTIVRGPDGALWFTETVGSAIGRITATGEVTEFPLEDRPIKIAAGPDGALWFTQGQRIGRITPAGTITSFVLPSGMLAQAISPGPGRALWFTDVGTKSIGRITTDGKVTRFRLPRGARTPTLAITNGPDRAVWFGIPAGHTTPGAIGRVTSNGKIRLFRLRALDHSPLDIATGRDGALWFTMPSHQIGRITPPTRR